MFTVAARGLVFVREHPARSSSCTGAVEAESGPMQAPALSQTAPVLTRSVWQCGSGYQELTERVDLLTFDFSKALAGLQGSAVARYASFPLQQK